MLENLKNEKAVEDICMRFYELEERFIENGLQGVIIIEPELLKRVPQRIGVVGGAVKAQAILGAVRGGYGNVLITDESLTTEILNLINKTNKSSI